MPANNCRRDCQERFRVEGEDPRRRWPTAKAQGPAFTLSPLARPGKAVALEARIELWSASDHLVAFQFLKTILRDDERFQQSRYAGHKIVLTETGLAATGVFTCRRAVGVEVFLLTSPFIERLRRANHPPRKGCADISPGVIATPLHRRTESVRGDHQHSMEMADCRMKGFSNGAFQDIIPDFRALL